METSNIINLHLPIIMNIIITVKNVEERLYEYGIRSKSFCSHLEFFNFLSDCL